MTNEEKRKVAADLMWLLYYNDVVYQEGIINEEQRNRIQNKIWCHKNRELKTGCE